jgi:prepilin-type N-terminal cleavage/methylation domain-containing protein
MMKDRMDAGSPHRGRPDAGFTLVEVMAAVVILAIALTAVFATFTSQQKSFTTQSRVAEMQQNLRLAAGMLVRDIRLAGYGLPPSNTTDNNDLVQLPAGKLPGGATMIRAFHPVDNTAGPDQIYILYLYDMDANQAPAWLAASMASASSATVDNAAGFLASGKELVLFADNNTADLYQTTSRVGNVLNLGGGYGASGRTYAYDNAVPVRVAKARFVRYYIDAATDPAHPTLMLDRMIDNVAPQPVADDIEDMQFVYGVDTGTDGVVDDEKNGSDGDTLTAAQIPMIRQVRLILLARSHFPERGWSGGRRPAAGNHAAAAASDGYRRRVIEVNIDARNSGT